MFLKIANPIRFKALSLTTKLMSLYILSTLAILMVVCIFLYPTFSTMINQLHGTHAAAIKIECYKNIIIALLLSSLSAIILGKIVAQNGLNRITEFANKMENISADSLHERIHLEDWPKELKSLGLKFNSMLDRLQTSFIQLSQFSSDIAHELRNPLNNLCGITELSLTKKNLPDEYRKTFELYMEEYQHLSKLVEHLLFLARSDQRQIETHKQALNARVEIMKILEYFQPIADENQINITCEGNETIYADAILFKRIINNLLSNALRYTPAHGSIKIMIQALDDKYIEISIHDTGVGIDDVHLPNIFNRFYRVDSSRSPQSGGLGLGLAITKSIVELHEGKIFIKSQLNIGTSVYVHLTH